MENEGMIHVTLLFFALNVLKITVNKQKTVCVIFFWWSKTRFFSSCFSYLYSNQSNHDTLVKILYLTDVMVADLTNVTSFDLARFTVIFPKYIFSRFFKVFDWFYLNVRSLNRHLMPWCITIDLNRLKLIVQPIFLNLFYIDTTLNIRFTCL